MVPNFVGSREGWELYIVAEDVTPSVTIYSSHPSMLFKTIGRHLSMYISDSLMMAF
jgi:hypothetical protein